MGAFTAMHVAPADPVCWGRGEGSAEQEGLKGSTKESRRVWLVLANVFWQILTGAAQFSTCTRSFKGTDVTHSGNKNRADSSSPRAD